MKVEYGILIGGTLGTILGSILGCVVAYYIFENQPHSGPNLARGMDFFYAYLPLGFLGGACLGGVTGAVFFWILFRKHSED